MQYNYHMKKIHYTPGQIEEVRRLYYVEMKTTTEIARLFSVSQPHILRKMDEWGMPRRRRWASPTRTCTGCGETKPRSEFRGKTSYCKPCHNKQSRKYSIQKQYGITIDEYNAMLMKQNNQCAICGKTPEENGRGLAVDHDHVTGKIRALLCLSCNNGLGQFNDDVELLQSAITYLKE